MLRRLVFLLSLFVLGSACYAQSKELILNTQPEPTVIEITESLTIDPNGNIQVTPINSSVCSATSSSCESIEVKVLDLSASSSSGATIELIEGQSVELDWRSSGAVSCDPIGTFPSWTNRGSLPADSRDATVAQRRIETVQGDASSVAYTVSLRCGNGDITAFAPEDIKLTVNELVPPSPTSCEGREPIKGWTRLTTGTLSCVVGNSLADCRFWEPKLWAAPFLSTNGQSNKILTNRSGMRQYVAIEFETVGMADTAQGFFDVESAGASIRFERVLATISKCPGDFNSDQVTGCYGRLSKLFPFSWRAAGSKANTDCVLEPNTKYYLNLLSTDSDFGVTPSEIEPIEACDDNLCGLLIVPRNSN